MHVIHVHVSALAVHDHGNGMFTIAMPARPLPENFGRMIEQVFPHTRQQIDQALNQESLIASSALESELDQSPSNQQRNIMREEKLRLREIYKPKEAR